MKVLQLIHSPRLWPAHGKERRVTWMELFFDLIFVAAVAQVGTPLEHGYTVAGLLRYAFLFVLIWWAWIGHTLFSTRFNADDLVQRILVLVQSFVAAVMAANAKEGLDSRSSAGFGAAYAGIRVVLVLQYLRARRIPETRRLTTHYAIGFSLAAALWVTSAFLDAPERYWVWAIALLVDVATPWLAMNHSMKVPPDAAHYPERVGLFTIILLGEFVAGVMRGIESQEDWTLSAASTAFMGMGFAFTVFWWYFDASNSSGERHVKTRKQAWLFEVWSFAHLPLFVGLGVAGVGFHRMITTALKGPLASPDAQIMSGAAFAVMISLAVIAATAQEAHGLRKALRTLRSQAALAAVVSLTAACIPLQPAILAAGFLSACIAQTTLARRQKLKLETRSEVIEVGS